MKFKPSIVFLIALIVGLFPLFNQAQSQNSEQVPRLQKAKLPDEESTRNYFTDLPLLNQQGKRVRFYSDVLKDKVVLMTFIYTSCRDACPLIIQRLSQVKEQLGELFGKQVFFIAVSVDPLRDTPEALAKYARQHKADQPGWIFLTGEKGNIDKILTKLGQHTAKPEDHTTMLLAGNVATRHWTKIAPTVPVAGIAIKLQDLAVESSAAGQSNAAVSSGRK